MSLPPPPALRETLAAFATGRGHRWADIVAVCEDCGGPLDVFRRMSGTSALCAAECWTVTDEVCACGSPLDEIDPRDHEACGRERGEPDPCECGVCGPCVRAGAWRSRWR